MTSPSNPMITRCPKCGTAFRVTASQLQSAKGAVRCGSCLHVFKAQEHLVATPATIKPAPTPPAKPADPQPQTDTKPAKIIDASSLDEMDDILISDDMDEVKSDGKYDHDDFIEIAPKPEISLFERKQRELDKDPETEQAADESWAEMLIEDDEDEVPQLGILKPKAAEPTFDVLPPEANVSDIESFANIDEQVAQDNRLAPAATSAPISTPGLKFSLVSEREATPATSAAEDELVYSEEFASIPDSQRFSQPNENQATNHIDPSLFDEPEGATKVDESSKRQVKTQPKIRAYDNSRTALLMNIIPAPIEFTAKRMHRWYQRKLWPTLSLLALIALIVQVAWFKFDHFSRVEPYRTAYLFICPYVGCDVPTLVDTRRIATSNLSVRVNPDIPESLKVDVLIINNAPFDQPFPDLELVFTDIDEVPVAARRFTPNEYLGGEMVGRELMPQNQKIYISLDLVDPGENAVNYYIQIVSNQ